MKLSLIFYLSLLVVMPFYSYGLIYWYTNETEQIHNEYSPEGMFKIIETTDDIDILKNRYIASIKSERKKEKDFIEAN